MKKKIAVAIVVILSISWIVFFSSEGSKLRKNHILTQGLISSISGGGKGNWGPAIAYKYYVKGKLQESSKRHGELKYAINDFIGKPFPIVFRHRVCWYDDDILITPNDFKRYGYEFPDTLKWVLKYTKGQ
jgi:hypothetical protein